MSSSRRTLLASSAAADLPSSRNVTFTAMSGRMRGSFRSSPMRTLTVAFSRFAVGTMAITDGRDGPVRIGVEHGVDAPPARTRPMKASLTSTSISIESMSTIVQMPVRVKPPPADIGEIISPGCALRSTTTPPNGARIWCLSSTAAVRCASSRAVCACACAWPQLRAQHADPGLGLGQVGLAGDSFFCDRLWTRARMRSASSQVGSDRGGGGLGGGGARLRQREVLFGQHAVEPRDDLAGLHHHALLDQHLDHLAGDLGRDRRLAPRHDIAGCAEADRIGAPPWRAPALAALRRVPPSRPPTRAVPRARRPKLGTQTARAPRRGRRRRRRPAPSAWTMTRAPAQTARRPADRSPASAAILTYRQPSVCTWRDALAASCGRMRAGRGRSGPRGNSRPPICGSARRNSTLLRHLCYEAAAWDWRMPFRPIRVT